MSTLGKPSKEVKWEVLETTELLHVDSRLTVSVQKLRLPDGRLVDDYYRVTFPDSAVIIAVTGIRRSSCPGSTFMGSATHSSSRAADRARTLLLQRELEETGYASDDWTLAAPYSDLNHVGARVHFFLARNARKLAEPDSNDLEEMEILLLNEASIVKNIKRGGISSMGSIAGLALAKLCLNAPGVRGAGSQKHGI